MRYAKAELGKNIVKRIRLKAESIGPGAISHFGAYPQGLTEHSGSRQLRANLFQINGIAKRVFPLTKKNRIG